MRYLLILALFVGLLSSCEKTINCAPAEYKFEFSNDKAIDTINYGGGYTNTSIIAGQNIVFYYHFSNEKCPDRADGDFAEALTFEIPTGSTSFNYNSADLQNSVVCYYERFAMMPVNAMRIVEGTIKGNKVSETTWNVQANIKIPDVSTTLTINYQFTKR